VNTGYDKIKGYGNAYYLNKVEASVYTKIRQIHAN